MSHTQQHWPWPQVNRIMKNVDQNGDRQVSRRELLVKMRQDRKYADFLKLPPHIRERDGTFRIFTAFFLSLDNSQDGFIDEAELSDHFGGGLDDEGEAPPPDGAQVPAMPSQNGSGARAVLL
jgi:hypothetical protein